MSDSQWANSARPLLLNPPCALLPGRRRLDGWHERGGLSPSSLKRMSSCGSAPRLAAPYWIRFPSQQPLCRCSPLRGAVLRRGLGYLMRPLRAADHGRSRRRTALRIAPKRGRLTRIESPERRLFRTPGAIKESLVPCINGVPGPFGCHWSLAARRASVWDFEDGPMQRRQGRAPAWGPRRRRARRVPTPKPLTWYGRR